MTYSKTQNKIKEEVKMAKLTKKELQQVAKEFNKVMSLDPVIKMDKTNDGLLADIKEAAEELRDDDKFSDGVEKTLIALGIREAEEKEVPELTKKTEVATKKETKTATTKSTPKKVGEKSSKFHYTRTSAVLEALSKFKKQPDKETCAEKANVLYQKNADGEDNMPESRRVTGYVFHVIEGMKKHGIDFS
jgi:hypothetical protein